LQSRRRPPFIKDAALLLFQSWAFLIFFAIVFPFHLLVKGARLRIPCLLIANYAFYGFWNPLYPLLLLYATTVDYLAVAWMSRGGPKKLCVGLSVVNGLTLLAFFKYAAFIADNVNLLLAKFGMAWSAPRPDFVLPVGISFYVFQSLTYTIDCYRGQVERETSFWRYAAFVSLFPQICAGPIQRARELLPQLRETPRIGGRDVADGASLFIVGLFKKVALADYFSLYVDEVYSMPGEYQAGTLMLATFAFAWQLYFDFSGYTDMARGVARMMGLRYGLNFNNPYLATGLGEFWQRWHISLSNWFRDYLYIPLGGNRKGNLRTYINMFLTMVISGLWHGASWNYVIWGALHGAGRVCTRELERTNFYRSRLPKIVKQLFTFVFVCFCWIFFRAETFADARLIVSRIFASGFGEPKFPLLMAGLALSVWAYQFVHESRFSLWLQFAPVKVALTAAMLIYIAVFARTGNQAFIYFQF